jgi:sterol desaturase/sphingolipid hydroxylase (fatty acid hydroxylase superfamily)
MQALYDYFINSIFYNLDFQHVTGKLADEWKSASAIFLVLALEIGFSGWKNSTLGMLSRPRRTDWWDIFSFFAFVLNIRRFLSSLLLLGLVTYLLRLQSDHSLALFSEWSLWITLPLAFVVQDFLLYWSHRFKHTNKMLWWVHEFHHSSTRVTSATSYRVHPLDYIVSLMVVYAPMNVIFGWGVTDHLAFMLIPAFSGTFNHSRVDTDLGWLGKWLLVSPRYHFMHHSKEMSVLNRNFGETFRFWDFLFRTDGGIATSINDVATGIEDNPYEEAGLWKALTHAVYQFYATPIRAFFLKFYP